MFETANGDQWEVQVDGSIRIVNGWGVSDIDLTWSDLRAMLKEMEKED